jgi:predicted DNA binding CopG/RHH family protein
VYAQNTLKQITKKKAYTIKLMGHDVDNIKTMAIKKGLPYQTFISSILHQVATKQIKV